MPFGENSNVAEVVYDDDKVHVIRADENRVFIRQEATMPYPEKFIFVGFLIIVCFGCMMVKFIQMVLAAGVDLGAMVIFTLTLSFIILGGTIVIGSVRKSFPREVTLDQRSGYCTVRQVPYFERHIPVDQIEAVRISLKNSRHEVWWCTVAFTLLNDQSQVRVLESSATDRARAISGAEPAGRAIAGALGIPIKYDGAMIEPTA